jgi:hypothetical protein
LSVEHDASFFKVEKSAKQETSVKASRAMLATCFHAGFLLGLLFDPDNGGDMFVRNVD